MQGEGRGCPGCAGCPGCLGGPEVPRDRCSGVLPDSRDALRDACPPALRDAPGHPGTGTLKDSRQL